MIKLENVSKYYHNEGIVTLGLRNINLTFTNSEFVAITGESGSGKTTLLNVISGIDSYEDGEMYVFGQETSHYDSRDWENHRRDKIGFIFQHFNLIDSFTVLKNVEIALVIQGLDRKTRRRRAKKIIERVGLKSHMRHRAAKLSGGQKQRLAIARALAKDTAVIVADEPTGNLDSQSSAEIIELLAEISQDRLVIMVTHDYAAVASYATRKIRLFDGEVVEDTATAGGSESVLFKPQERRLTFFRKLFTVSLLGLFGQPKRAVLLLAVVAVMVFFSFLASGGYLITIQASVSRGWGNRFNDYPERLIVIRQDRDSFTAADKTTLESLRDVDKVIVENMVLDLDLTSGFNLKGNHYYCNGYLNVVDEFKGDKLYGRLPTAAGEIMIAKYFSKDEAAHVSDIIGTDIDVRAYHDMFPFFDNSYEIVGVYVSNNYYDEFVISDEDLNDIYQLLKVNEAGYEIAFDDHMNVHSALMVHPDLVGYETYRSSGYYPNSELYINGQKMESLFLSEDIIRKTECIYISMDFFETLKIEEDYAYTVNLKDADKAETVMDKLFDLGYYAMSPHLAKPYDFNRMMAIPLTIMAFISSMINLIVVYLLTYVVVRTILLSKKRDYAILRTLGLSYNEVKATIRLELVIALIFSYPLFAIVILLLRRYIPEFAEIFSSLGLRHYLFIFIVNISLILLISHKFNKLIKKRNLFMDLKGGGEQ